MKVKDRVTRVMTLDEDDIEVLHNLASKILNHTKSVGFTSRLQLTEKEKEYLTVFIISDEYTENIDSPEGSERESDDCQIATLTELERG